jgi:energy-coupling factor transporter ATP-binding protein EcfA2
VLLDEPTRGLDYEAKARLAAVLRALAVEGHAVVVSTHDVEFAAAVAHRVVVLADGEVVADGPTAEVVVSSPAFAPQVAKVLHPAPWLTVDQVAAALAGGVGA